LHFQQLSSHWKANTDGKGAEMGTRETGETADSKRKRNTFSLKSFKQESLVRVVRAGAPLCVTGMRASSEEGHRSSSDSN
jgi:hypothetical protein